MIRRKTESNQAKPPVTVGVEINHLYSHEALVSGNKQVKFALEDISFQAKAGEVWGVGGNSEFEINLCLEIIGNIKPYLAGKCILAERGMMRKKRVILPHVFYIGASNMIYENMKVLEFLMFATEKSGKRTVERQEQILEILVGLGLGYLSLSPIHRLSREERAVISLIAGLLSTSMILIMNLPEFIFDDTLKNAIDKIGSFVIKQNRLMIIGTLDHSLIDRACSHVAYILEGKMTFHGQVETFKKRYDRVVFYIHDSRAENLQRFLSQRLKQYDVVLSNHKTIELRRRGNEPFGRLDEIAVYHKLMEAKVIPDSIKLNELTMDNAFQEFLREHDL
jgi:ABC-2 type transport system ATP-binding protein